MVAIFVRLFELHKDNVQKENKCIMPLRLILDKALGWGTDPSTGNILEQKSGGLL